MSFQDLRTLQQQQVLRQVPGINNRSNVQRTPPVTVVELPVSKKEKKKRPIVLHGRVIRRDDSMPSEDEREEDAPTEDAVEEGVRNVKPTPASEFTDLSLHISHYTKMVSDLDRILQTAGESPEQTWRAQILLKSAQDTYGECWNRLAAWNSPDGTNRAASMKLHRDLKRAHKCMQLAKLKFEKRQSAEIAVLGAVGWKPDNSIVEDDDVDYFDRAMRQREMEQMNQKMHTVNKIYKELAALTDAQQPMIDRLQDEARNTAGNVHAAAEHFACIRERERFCGAMNFDDEATYDGGDDSTWRSMLDGTAFTAEDEKRGDESVQLNTELRVDEKFHWFMPFETFTEDIQLVKKDIVGMGKDILSQSQKLDCRRGTDIL